MPRNQKRVPLTSKVTDQLLDLLRQEGLSEGDSIPPTGELAERFGVSRTVIREALAELTGRGVIRRQQGREGIVSIPGSEEISSVFRTRANSSGYTFAQLHQLREVLEIEAARGAAKSATLQDIASLSDLLHTIAASTDVDSMLEADLEFHRAIARTANPLFGLVLDGLSPLLMDSRRAAWESYIAHGGDIEAAITRHVTIRDRIVAGDSEGAADAMLADLADTREQLRSMDAMGRQPL